MKNRDDPRPFIRAARQRALCTLVEAKALIEQLDGFEREADACLGKDEPKLKESSAPPAPGGAYAPVIKEHVGDYP